MLRIIRLINPQVPDGHIEMAYLKGNHVHVLSYNAGVLGVFANRSDALKAKFVYQVADYKGLKVEEHLIG